MSVFHHVRHPKFHFISIEQSQTLVCMINTMLCGSAFICKSLPNPIQSEPNTLNGENCVRFHYGFCHIVQDLSFLLYSICLPLAIFCLYPFFSLRDAVPSEEFVRNILLCSDFTWNLFLFLFSRLFWSILLNFRIIFLLSLKFEKLLFCSH